MGPQGPTSQHLFFMFQIFVTFYFRLSLFPQTLLKFLFLYSLKFSSYLQQACIELFFYFLKNVSYFPRMVFEFFSHFSPYLLFFSKIISLKYRSLTFLPTVLVSLLFSSNSSQISPIFLSSF